MATINWHVHTHPVNMKARAGQLQLELRRQRSVSVFIGVQQRSLTALFSVKVEMKFLCLATAARSATRLFVAVVVAVFLSLLRFLTTTAALVTSICGWGCVCSG
ncbi:unnamed protein product [Ceratitis capitata]|uniref:(Mediterranean fruit fly) hypothetical protein n=1 Tax=Ceratitis capitata TaxID=7213 RepID=A0A811UGJ7_CERCA|nr:unnamed protein product [Ceratitis capitata]